MEQPQLNIAKLTNIITAPKAVFLDLREKPTILFPLLLLITSSVIVLLYFFATVDFAWMIDQMVTTENLGKNDAEREALQKGMNVLSAKLMGSVAIAKAVIGFPLVFSTIAVYFLLVNKVLGSENFIFRSWFSFVCWCSVPSLFTSLASLVNVILATNGQITFEAINPISFKNLFFDLKSHDPLFGLLGSWDPMNIWSVGLMILGFNQWTNISIVKSAVIVFAPMLVIYGIRIGIALA